jgi:hypothetical protein
MFNGRRQPSCGGTSRMTRAGNLECVPAHQSARAHVTASARQLGRGKTLLSRVPTKLIRVFFIRRYAWVYAPRF